MKTDRKQTPAVLGAVLAGGTSHRMGRDKALLEVAGRSMLAQCLALLQTVLSEVVVAAPRRREYEALGAELVPDHIAGLGPLGGLHAALVRAGDRPVFVLACDMPLVNQGLVRWLLAAGSGQRQSIRVARPGWRTQAWVPEHEGRVQPLCGLYRGECLPAVESALAERRLSARDLLDELVTERLQIDETKSWYHPYLFTNVNEACDYRALTERLERRS